MIEPGELSDDETTDDENGMTFSDALDELTDGNKITRSGWNGKGMWIEIQNPDEDSKMTLPYIYMSTASGDLVPWIASQSDILADDWEVVV
jgi:hypothetical protein